jgi:hypothetical protein
MLKTSNKQLLIVVRENLLEEVIRKWNLCEPVVFRIQDTDYLTAANVIMDHLNA